MVNTLEVAGARGVGGGGGGFMTPQGLPSCSFHSLPWAKCLLSPLHTCPTQPAAAVSTTESTSTVTASLHTTYSSQAAPIKTLGIRHSCQPPLKHKEQAFTGIRWSWRWLCRMILLIVKESHQLRHSTAKDGEIAKTKTIAAIPILYWTASDHNPTV